MFSAGAGCSTRGGGRGGGGGGRPLTPPPPPPRPCHPAPPTHRPRRLWCPGPKRGRDHPRCHRRGGRFHRTNQGQLRVLHRCVLGRACPCHAGPRVCPAPCSPRPPRQHVQLACSPARLHACFCTLASSKCCSAQRPEHPSAVCRPTAGRDRAAVPCWLQVVDPCWECLWCGFQATNPPSLAPLGDAAQVLNTLLDLLGPAYEAARMLADGNRPIHRSTIRAVPWRGHVCVCVCVLARVHVCGCEWV